MSIKWLLRGICLLLVAFTTIECKHEEPKKYKAGFLFYSFRSSLPVSSVTGSNQTCIDIRVEGPETQTRQITSKSKTVPACVDYTNYGHAFFLLDEVPYSWEATEYPSGENWGGTISADPSQCSGYEIR